MKKPFTFTIKIASINDSVKNSELKKTIKRIAVVSCTKRFERFKYERYFFARFNHRSETLLVPISVITKLIKSLKPQDGFEPCNICVISNALPTRLPRLLTLLLLLLRNVEHLQQFSTFKAHTTMK